MTATAAGWDSPATATASRGPLEDVRSELEKVRDFGVRPLVEDTLPNTLAGDRMRAALAAVELAYQEIGKALDTIQ